MTKSFSFDAIGTMWQINIEIEKDITLTELEKKIADRISIFDKDYSRFRNDSLVFAMSQKIGMYDLPKDAKPMFDLYKKLYKITDGAFTPLIGDTLIDAGYDANYSLKPGVVKAPYSWQEAIEYDYPSLKIKKPTMLDLGGLGKGYLVDIISDLIKSESLNSFTIDAGGDIYTHNREITIGLQHPEQKDEVIGSIKINNTSLCGSAGSYRTWADYHHIINPHTLHSPKHILATWVKASSTLVADAMATCLFLVDSATLRAYFDFEFLLVADDFSVEKSDNFKADIFTA
ncbi:MAG: hypothetical protein RL641_387 [Candidatus Parcubacteria bacterium]|jgi:thiamine biosynthesis lipoprotein